jgi:hypothetical protein
LLVEELDILWVHQTVELMVELKVEKLELLLVVELVAV